MRVPVAVREGFSTGRLCSRTYVGKSLQVSRPLDPYVERKYSQSRFLIIVLWSTVHISKGIGSFTTFEVHTSRYCILLQRVDNIS